MSRFVRYLESLVKQPFNPGHLPQWQINLLWALRVLTLVSGVRQTFWGETTIGLLILFCLFLITIPSFITRGKITRIPVEIEILFFIMVFFQFILGEAADFYTTIPYYDKFVHFFLPLMLGFITFIIIYMLYFTKRLQAAVSVMFVATFLIALGIGALWEITEYLSDELLLPRIPGWHQFQGSLTEDPLHDTMNDLIDDSLGALLGATLAASYVAKSKGSKKYRLNMLTQLSDQIFKK